MMEAVQDQSQIINNQTPLLENQRASQRNLCSSAYNAFVAVASAPENGLEWIVEKISDIGGSCGVGVRGAKLALAATSLGIIGEFGLQIARVSINPDAILLQSLFPGRLSGVILSVLSAMMCLPLNGRLSVCCCYDTRCDRVMRLNPKLMPRAALITALLTCGLICTTMTSGRRPLLSSTQVYDFIPTGLMNIPLLLLTAGISKLIKNQYPDLIPTPEESADMWGC